MLLVDKEDVFLANIFYLRAEIINNDRHYQALRNDQDGWLVPDLIPQRSALESLPPEERKRRQLCEFPNAVLCMSIKSADLVSRENSSACS
jgi:hypothetical protein